MVTRLTSFAFHGVDAFPVTVEVQAASGANYFAIVGLPDKSVSEARDRVRAALTSIGLGLPAKRVTVNLAPADLPKEGGHFDLPIALGLMVEMGAVPRDAIDGTAIVGELGLDGSIAKINGVLPAAIAAQAAGLKLVCPHQNGSEAAWAGDDLAVIAPATLIQFVNHIKGLQVLAAPAPGNLSLQEHLGDLADVKGQETAKRALEVAAAGGHNMLMVGPPGAGKSMLASRLPAILPPLSPAEMLETSMVRSMAGLLDKGELCSSRPYRAPHHSASMAAMVGGGVRAKPGEASLAHNGVLFLDELPEFAPQVLDSLRQPLETGDVMIARANARVRYPSRFQLIAAMNPCRCGQTPASGTTCAKGPSCGASYRARVSGPFLDRIDIRVALRPVSALDLAKPNDGETSAVVAARVKAAREAQADREQTSTEPLESKDGLPARRVRSKPENTSFSPAATNASLSDARLGVVAKPDADGNALLIKAAETLELSARAYHRILRISRTLADLDGSTGVKRRHISEAIAHRAETIFSGTPSTSKTRVNV
ncbi:MAG: YifB family Mg chelatase-like AAA ATPase [Pseudomonadota bacterium]